MDDGVLFTKDEVNEIVKKACEQAQIEALHLAIKIHHDSFSRGTCRLALYNAILRLQGKEKELA